MSNPLDFGCSAKAPSKVSGSGASIKYFPRALNSGGGAAPWSVTNPTLSNLTPGTAAGGAQGPSSGINTAGAPSTFPNVNNPTGSLWVPNASFDGVPFEVYAAGTFGSDTGDPSNTVNIQLQAVTGTYASPTYTTIASTSALVPNYAQVAPWMIQAELVGDSNSGFLVGFYTAMQGNVVHTTNGTSPYVAIDNVLTGLDFQNGNTFLQRGAVLGLVVGVTFGTSDKSNQATMTVFTVES